MFMAGKPAPVMDWLKGSDGLKLLSILTRRSSRTRITRPTSPMTIIPS